ncbi:MAG: hypothetical protein F6J87_05070 [Spirulina sp. SIO3F2]|nr:hypothetical protein [Spirulina sp. SIO3F2]
MVYYQVGGSLASQASSYITRKADAELYEQLKAGQLCYVFNARQMGKSSLLVRTRSRLQQEGYRCSFIDFTSIGSEQITPLQWYRGMLYSLYEGFDLSALDDALDLEAWVDENQSFSLLQQLTHLIEQIVCAQLPKQPLVVFIDEIDSILSLPFAVDDFFALIRYCYNQRAINPAYQRLTFALFGVATPSDLIQDLRRTPFNIGCPIALTGFSFAEAQVLANGFYVEEGNPEAMLQAILDWTNGQPFLTQKLCQMVVDLADESPEGTVTVPPGTERVWIDELLRDRLLTHWQSQDEPEHLRTIRNRLLSDDDKAARLLGIYQQVLTTEAVRVDDSPEQANLLLSGVVIKQGDRLQVKNRIYAAVFKPDWVEQQLAELRPYAPLLAAWVASDRQDDSRLLRGQALHDAQDWSLGKQLSDLDYQYLRASEQSDREATQKALKAEYLQGQVQQQRRFLRVVTGALVAMTALGLLTFWQYRQARRSEQLALRSEIDALIAASNGNYNSNQRLDATIDAIRAYRELERLDRDDPDLRRRAQTALHQAIYTSPEYNRVILDVGLSDVALSPDDSMVAIAANDGRIFWLDASGALMHQIQAHSGNISQLVFSPDGQALASIAADGTLKLWQLDGTLITTLLRKLPDLRGVRFSSDGQYLAASQGRSTSIWRRDGTLVTKLSDSLAFDFSPDGRWLVTVGAENTVQLWQWPLTADSPPQPSRTFLIRANAQAAIKRVVFSPDGQKLGFSFRRDTPQVWDLEGHQLTQFDLELVQIGFTPDSEQLVMVSTDKEILFGNLEGTITQRLRGHQANLQGFALTQDGQRLVSVAEDGSIRFWQLQNPFVQHLPASRGISNSTIDAAGRRIAAGGEDGWVRLWNRPAESRFRLRPQYRSTVQTLHTFDLQLSPDGQQLVSVARDAQVSIWNSVGELLQQLQLPHRGWSVALSPDQQWLAVGAFSGDIYLWQRSPNGQYRAQPQVLSGHRLRVRDLTFSADSQLLLSASSDQTVKVWQVSSQTLRHTLTGHLGEVWGVAVSPNGQWFASASADRTVRLWHQDGTLTQTFRGHQGTVTTVVFDATSETVWSGAADGTVRQWGLQGQRLLELPHDGLQIKQLAIDCLGKTLVASGLDHQVWVWSLSEVLDTNELSHACNWVNDYLMHNAPIGDRDLCK